MSEANNQVKISIFDRNISKGPADPDYIKKIAQYLDEKMREVQSDSPVLSRPLELPYLLV